MFGLMWTLISLFAVVGDFSLIIFQRYFGFVATRLFYGGAQTAGFALIGMYQKSPYNVLIGEALLCFAASRSFSQNVQSGDLYFENGTRRFSVLATGVAMFGSMVFLFAKKLEESNTMPIPEFFLLLTCTTAVIHLRTIFLLPKDGFPSSITCKESVFKSSIVGQILAKRKKKVSAEIEIENEASSGPYFKEMTAKGFLKIMIAKRFLLFTGIFVILMYRHQTAWSHLNAWLDFTYSNLAASCVNKTSNSSDCFKIEEYKNSIIDFSGLVKLTHPIISFLMFSLHRCLAKSESQKKHPVENRPMVISLVSYLIAGIAVFASVTLLSMFKSGESTLLGFAMVFLMTIN